MAETSPEVNQGSLDELTKDWTRLRRQKSHKTGGVEGRVLQNLAFVYDEQHTMFRNGALHMAPPEDNKLQLTFNLIKGRLNKLIGRLSSVNPSYKAQPDKKDPQALAEAEVVDKLILALDHKLVQPSRTWEILWWMAIGGTAFEYTPWIPNASVEPNAQFSDSGEILYRNTLTEEIVPESAMTEMANGGLYPPEVFEVYEIAEPVGDVGAEVLGPLNVFVDHQVRSIADLAPDQRVYIAKIRTIGWIEENFGVTVEPQKDLSLVLSKFSQPSVGDGGAFLQDLLPLIQGSVSEDDPDMAIVVEGYLPPSTKNPEGRYDVFIPGDRVLYSDVNPYKDVPLTDFHWSPVTTTFWTGGYVETLIAPQRFINKRLSQLGEQANATVYANLLLGPGLEPADIPADYPGAVKNGLAENGTPLVARLAPPELPTWYLPALQTTMQLFNDMAGGSDLMEESKFPGQLRGPLAVPMLQEIIDTEWGPLYFHIGERMARVKQMRLDRVKEFYPPVRTLHYTDRDQKDEVLVFHKDEVLGKGLNFNVTVDRGELVPELRSLREARVKDRLSGPLAILYMDERTGKFDKSKIAADLKFGDAGRESREARYRKLGAEIVEMLWQAKPVPPVLPFFNHAVLMDELEAAMSTMEYFRASPQIQQAFTQRWEAHRQYLIQEAQAQQAAMANGMIQTAVAQATQQAAAQAAAETVNSTRMQMDAQSQQPTREMVSSAAQKAGNQPSQLNQGAKKRSLTFKEEG